MKTQKELKDFLKTLGHCDNYHHMLFNSEDLDDQPVEYFKTGTSIKLSDLIKIKEFLQIDDFELTGNLSWRLDCYPIETGELKLKKEEYEKGYNDGFNDKEYRPTSRSYIDGYDEGKFQRLQLLPGKIFKRDYLI